ncbi:hypothetical protein PsorP6_011963 [Peronosclerospora sorghi]|uniref:Uncharacterized protein n=1 Tax=Peronosclerospora sorghi TaxID=230839 RepID=A0ACC0WHX5_9STRA|nr:hypothetical protein PsorP6_011963 [Peronosclerospora sorghi]
MNEAYAKWLVQKLDIMSKLKVDHQPGWLHNAEFVHQELKRVMEINSLQVSSVIAYVINSPTAIVKMLKDLSVSRLQSLS